MNWDSNTYCKYRYFNWALHTWKKKRKNNLQCKEKSKHLKKRNREAPHRQGMDNDNEEDDDENDDDGEDNEAENYNDSWGRQAA